MNRMLCRPLHRGITQNNILAIQRLFANGELGGYWPASPEYAFEDSSGTIAASVDGVVGYRVDVALGNHAIQATTANKPYLRRTSNSNKPWYDSNTSTGALTATFSGSLGSACTIATLTPEGVTFAENQTVGSTYNICTAYGYDSDVLMINRALTATEKALVTRVFSRNLPVLGSELVTNGTFDVDESGWTSDNYSMLTVSNNVLSSTNNSERPSAISPQLSVKQNKYYKITFTVVEYISYLNWRLRDSLSSNGEITSVGTKNFILRADTDNQSLWFYSNAAGQNFKIKAVSVKGII